MHPRSREACIPTATKIHAPGFAAETRQPPRIVADSASDEEPSASARLTGGGGTSGNFD
jgi:hypothetical protein